MQHGQVWWSRLVLGSCLELVSGRSRWWHSERVGVVLARAPAARRMRAWRCRPPPSASCRGSTCRCSPGTWPSASRSASPARSRRCRRAPRRQRRWRRRVAATVRWRLGPSEGPRSARSRLARQHASAQPASPTAVAPTASASSRSQRRPARRSRSPPTTARRSWLAWWWRRSSSDSSSPPQRGRARHRNPSRRPCCRWASWRLPCERLRCCRCPPTRRCSCPTPCPPGRSRAASGSGAGGGAGGLGRSPPPPRDARQHRWRWAPPPCSRATMAGTSPAALTEFLAPTMCC